MNRRHRSSRTGMLSIGWLFADLLLALAALFLLTNPNTPPRVKATITATPTPSPTPMPPHLELKPHRVTLQVDANGLLNNDMQAINSFELQIEGQNVLQGRSVGLVIAYGGAPTAFDIDTAQRIAKKIYSLLSDLGQKNFAFSRASYYDPLYLLGGNSNTVVLDIYLFAQ